MIIVAIILGIIIGNLCVDSTNMVNATEHLTVFYIICVGLLCIAHAYFFKSARLSLKTIAKTSKYFRILSVVIAFVFTVKAFLSFVTVTNGTPDKFELFSSAGMLASGFALLFVVVLTNRGKIQNQLAASVSTVPILWLVYELIVIFKDNLSNPHISEYILAIFIYIATSLALYYFSSAFCVNDKTNHFREYYVLSVFVCVVYAAANKAGYTSSEGINTAVTIGSCALFNVFMLPYYIPDRLLNLKKVLNKPEKQAAPVEETAGE